MSGVEWKWLQEDTNIAYRCTHLHPQYVNGAPTVAAEWHLSLAPVEIAVLPVAVVLHLRLEGVQKKES